MRTIFLIGVLCLLSGLKTIGQNISAQSSSAYYHIGINESSALSESKYYKLNLVGTSGVSQSNQFNLKNSQAIFGISETKYYNIYRIDSKSNNSQITATPSPVDYNKGLLPVSTTKNLHTYALIIGNEDYSSFQTGLSKEQNVDFAINDAQLFKELCVKSLGIPNENIIYLENAGYVKLKQSISQFNLISKHSSGKANLIFYYAGHGLPYESTKTPYIIPVDASGTSFEYAISLPSIYKSLTEYQNNKVIVFLDACFTGGARHLSLISSRGVKVKPKQEINAGDNLVVFSSSSSEQSSLPFKEKQHGIFTYFLVNKFIESKGDVSLGELKEYLCSKVTMTSILVNKIEQVPVVFFSPNISASWENWKLNK